MAETITDLARQLAEDAAIIEKRLLEQNYESAQAMSRVALSVASRMHARITAMAEAYAEIQRDRSQQ